MNGRTRFLHIAAGTIALALVACGGGGNETPTPENDPDDQALAQSLNLRLADFPTGWAETPDSDEESPFEDECTFNVLAGRTALAESGDFSRNDVDSISSSVAIYESADGASAAVDRLPELANCIRDAALDGALGDDEGEVTDATASTLQFPPIGEKSIAMRIMVEAEDAKTGFTAEVYLDVIWVHIGRISFGLVSAGVFSPFDIAMMEDLARVVTDRVAAAAQ